MKINIYQRATRFQYLGTNKTGGSQYSNDSVNIASRNSDTIQGIPDDNEVVVMSKGVIYTEFAIKVLDKIGFGEGVLLTDCDTVIRVEVHRDLTGNIVYYKGYLK